MTPEQRVDGHARLSVLRRIIRVERSLKQYADPPTDTEASIEDVAARLTIVEERVDVLTATIERQS